MGLHNLAETAEQVRVRVEHLTDGSVGHWKTIRLGAPPVGVTPRASDHRYTSTEVIDAETKVLRAAQAGRALQRAQVRADTIDPDVMATLGSDQQAAVTKLTTGGEFLVVLTAPACAGKTTTLGAAAKIWENAGFHVVGLAPSARAAAELAKATGGTADTLAKWLHQQSRLRDLPEHERAAWTLTARTVLVVDGASMASTFDLHQLAATAWNADAKVVLVGDPAQIGAINAPGGLLPALAARGHGIELSQVHRFHHEWEADASLRLRKGDRSVIDVYGDAGRLHTVPDPDTAAAAVFAHWQQARADGVDVMMLARTRDDVDQLNALAKTAAQHDGQSHGPKLVIGDKSARHTSATATGTPSSPPPRPADYSSTTSSEKAELCCRRPTSPTTSTTDGPPPSMVRKAPPPTSRSCSCGQASTANTSTSDSPADGKKTTPTLH